MPIAVERGEGVWVFTSNGERFLDLYGGHAVAGSGHCHPHVVDAIRRQTEKLLFYSNLVYSDIRARTAEKLVSLAQLRLRRPSSVTPEQKQTRTQCAWPEWPQAGRTSSVLQAASMDAPPTPSVQHF